MPKPLKKRAVSRPKSDPNQAAADLVRRSTEGDDTPTRILPAQLSAYMAALGRKGGKASGAKRMMNLSPEERQEIAAKAARARWARAKKRSKP